jgi:endonuclease YncB( thermonuclease family)
MKKLLFLIPLLFASLLFAKDPISVISGRVVKVSDGDTITLLNADNAQVRVRLYGIDAPESKQDFGQTSRKYLSDGKIKEYVAAAKNRKNPSATTTANCFPCSRLKSKIKRPFLPQCRL